MLSSLAQASKAVWDYSAEQLAVFRDELTLRPEEIEPGHAHVLEAAAGKLRGFYSLLRRPDGRLELEHLFVAPEALRQGIGRRLLAHAIERARELGDDRLVIQSDPNACDFYLGQGADLVERIPSSIPGRSIPFLVLPIPARCRDLARD